MSFPARMTAMGSRAPFFILANKIIAHKARCNDGLTGNSLRCSTHNLCAPIATHIPVVLQNQSENHDGLNRRPNVPLKTSFIGTA